MATETVHETVGRGDAPIAHDDGDLMQGLGQGAPEVPVVVGTAHVGAGITFDRVVQIRKFEGVAEEEYRGVVAHHVPVAFLCVEFKDPGGMDVNVRAPQQGTGVADVTPKANAVAEREGLS